MYEDDLEDFLDVFVLIKSFPTYIFFKDGQEKVRTRFTAMGECTGNGRSVEGEYNVCRLSPGVPSRPFLFRYVLWFSFCDPSIFFYFLLNRIYAELIVFHIVCFIPYTAGSSRRCRFCDARENDARECSVAAARYHNTYVGMRKDSWKSVRLCWIQDLPVRPSVWSLMRDTRQPPKGCPRRKMRQAIEDDLLSVLGIVVKQEKKKREVK